MPLLDIYPKELKARSQKDICIPMFIAALFIIVKRWKHHKCPSRDEQTNNRIFFSLKKKEGKWDFPGSAVVKTLCFQCRGRRFNPWSGN